MAANYNAYGDVHTLNGHVVNQRLHGRQLFHPQYGKPQLNHGVMGAHPTLYGVKGYYEMRHGHPVYIQSHNVRRPGPAHNNHPHLQVPAHAYPPYSQAHYQHAPQHPQPPPQPPQQNNNGGGGANAQDNEDDIDFDDAFWDGIDEIEV